MPSDRPNVLWIVPDQHRPGWLGCAGHPVRTPNVDGLSERGVRFENAVCPSPVCAPSRACLATGTNYDDSPVRGNGDDLPPAATTVYGRLRDEAGYHVMGCGKFDLHKASYSWGVDGQHRLGEWGFSAGVDNAGKLDAVLALVTDTHPAKLDPDERFDWVDAWRSALDAGDLRPRDPYAASLQSEGLLEPHVEDYARRYEADGPAAFPTPLPERAYCDNWIGRRGLELLADAPEDRPWFLQVNFAGPHAPWDVTDDMHGWYREPPVDLGTPRGEDGRPAEYHAAVRRNYAAMIENLDRWVGRFRDRVAGRGELDDTVIAFASDHGEMLGDHGRYGKSVPYRAATGVPLVVAGAGVESRDPVAAPASLVDLGATALHDAGLVDDADADSPPGWTDARSLRPVLSGGAPPREVVTSGLGGWRLATDGRFDLVTGYDFGDDLGGEWDDPVLFDRRADPGAVRSVAADHPDAVERLRDALGE